MNYIGKFISNFKDAYNEINGATLTGAIDAVVVRQKDGSFISSPFHVRFGKIGVLRSREKVVDIEINGEPVDIHMKLGETGEAFFVEELEEGDEVSAFLGTSPLPHYLDYAHTHAEDDARSQDSGVEAEEVISKTLKVKQGKEDSADPTALSEPPDFLAQDHDKSSAMRGTYDGTRRDCAAPVEFSVSGEAAKARTVPRARHTLPTNFSLCMDMQRQGSWRYDLVRSKSLSSELPIRRASSNILDGRGSKTDIEDTARNARRRRKKRTSSRRHHPKGNESQSSDDNTTSETANIRSLSVTDTTHEHIFVMEDLENVQDSNRVAMEKSLKGSSHWASNLSASMGPDFHPFSDTDLSPPTSPSDSRSGTPVKSDTEYEYEKQKSELSETSAASRDAKWSWTWGELPTPPVTPRSNASSRQVHVGVSSIQEGNKMQSMTQVEDAHRSMLGNMFSFMRATKKARHNPESEGIYLDDLNLDELEPEVAALYFPRNTLLEKQSYTGFRSVAKDEDVESGNGTSLPQSPHSVEGAIGGAKLPPLDADFEESSRHPIFDYRGYHDLAFSLCGALHEHLDGPFPESLFLQSLVTYDDFCENPHVMDNPNLVVRLEGKYMNWATAAPQIMSLVLFQRPLPPKVIENVVKDNMPKKEIRKRSESKGYSWFYWGRHQDQAAQKNSSSKGEQDPTPRAITDGITSSGTSPSATEGQESRPPTSEEASRITTIAHFPETHVAPASDGTTTSSSSPQQTKEAPTMSRKRDDSSESEDQDENRKGKRYRKTIRLSTDQIKKLNLRNGSNEVVFSVTTAYQGTTRCKCHIFLWNCDEKIVVSDIDGTITKSDVLGHILPIIGKDWAQGGVAQLFTKIKNNGYNFLYLSARAIGQARITRDYLRSIKQGDVSLPDGPLLLNPTSLIQAFHREVIERKPEEFKISCLRDIKALFPGNENPFYAGYGNKINDVWAYRAVGIPIQRIFTINHRGELKHELTQTFQTTYSNLTDIAHHMFPAAQEREINDEFSSLQFWRPALPDFSAEIEAALSERALK